MANCRPRNWEKCRERAVFSLREGNVEDLLGNRGWQAPYHLPFLTTLRVGLADLPTPSFLGETRRATRGYLRTLGRTLRPTFANLILFFCLFAVSILLTYLGFRRVGFPLAFMTAVAHSCPVLSPGCMPYVFSLEMVNYSNLVLDGIVWYLVAALAGSTLVSRR